MTFVLIVMAMVVIAALAALRQSDTTQDFNDLGSRFPVARTQEQGGTDAGEDPASVPEAFTTAPRGCVASHPFPPVGRDAANTLDDAMAEWDAEWQSPPSGDAA